MATGTATATPPSSSTVRPAAPAAHNKGAATAAPANNPTPPAKGSSGFPTMAEEARAKKAAQNGTSKPKAGGPDPITSALKDIHQANATPGTQTPRRRNAPGHGHRTVQEAADDAQGSENDEGQHEPQEPRDRPQPRGKQSASNAEPPPEAPVRKPVKPAGVKPPGDSPLPTDPEAQASDAGEHEANVDDADGADEVSEVPKHLKDSALRMGWTEEDVEALFESNPERAISTFERIHQGRVEIATRMSALGRAGGAPRQDPNQQQPGQNGQPPKGAPAFGQQNGQQQQGQQPQPQPQPQHGQDDPYAPPSFPAAKDFIEKYGGIFGSDEDAGAYHSEVVAPMQRLASQLDMVIDVLSASESKQQLASMDSVFAQYPEFSSVFGTGPFADLSDSNQRAKRYEVFERTQAIEQGSRQMGQPISRAQAVSDAVWAVLGPKATEIARQGLRGQIKAQQRGFSVRPGSAPRSRTLRGGADPKAAQLDQALDAVGAELAKLGGGRGRALG